MPGNPNDEPDNADSAAFDTPLVPTNPLPFTELCARIHNRISAFLAQDVTTQRLKDVQEQTRASLAVISEALTKYNLPELSLSYNGGKDCLVLLVLYLAALHAKGLTAPQSSMNPMGPDNEAEPGPVKCVYIQAQHPFPAVEAFVASSVATYGITLATYAKPMKAAFADYLQDNNDVQAIFVGTRRTDPHGQHLTNFDPTDHGWPQFMRIHPVIDWHYVEIWTFIRHLRVPYCSLYDQGYTSLGGTTDTLPNPALLLKKSDGSAGKDPSEPEFRPAYDLVEDSEERLGRDK